MRTKLEITIEICGMTDTYIAVLTILNTSELSVRTILFVVAQLNATNEIHNKIRDYLFEFIATGNTFLIEVVKEVCRREIFLLSQTTSE